MIELQGNSLKISFPEVHAKAHCRIEFQRTLRIPDDNNEYPLPPGFGPFPLDHVDNLGEKLPQSWRTHGGIYLPMYQSEAMWIKFFGDYPFAIKIAAGKINAVTGNAWKNPLDDKPQDYIVSSEQAWLDGYNVGKGRVRQFVAMPLGEGYSAEEQLTGQSEHGGLQIIAYPMKASYYHANFERYRVESECYLETPMFCRKASVEDMALAPGGLMRQEIHEDEYGIDAWDHSLSARCFVHITNSETYRQLTGRQAPGKPFKAKDYTQAGLPWFEYYRDGKALGGSEKLAGLVSVAAKWLQKTQKTYPDNTPVKPAVVKKLGDAKVREGDF